MDYSPPGSSIHGILQAKILEWVAMPSSRGSSPPRDRTVSLLSHALAGSFFTSNTTWEALLFLFLFSRCPPFSSCPDLSQYQDLFQWVSTSNQVAKVLELQLQHQSFQWIFRSDFLSDWLVWSPCSPRDAQESSPTSQFESINCLVPGC